VDMTAALRSRRICRRRISSSGATRRRTGSPRIASASCTGGADPPLRRQSTLARFEVVGPMIIPVKEVNRLKNEPWTAAVWPLRRGQTDPPSGLGDALGCDERRLSADLLPQLFYEPPYFPGYRDIWDNAVMARRPIPGARRGFSPTSLSRRSSTTFKSLRYLCHPKSGSS
jgi:hypothetical protein